MASALRGALLQKAVLPEKLVHIDDVGDVLMIGLDVPEVSKLLRDDSDETLNGADKIEKEMKQGARFIIKCAHDPVTREHVFDIADEEVLLRLPSMMFFNLRTAAFEVCGLHRSKDEEKKD